MGNTCCGDKFSAQVQPGDEIAFAKQRNSMFDSRIGGFDPAPQQSSIDPSSIGTKSFELKNLSIATSTTIKALVDKFGIFAIDSVPDQLRGTQDLPVYKIVKSEFAYEGQAMEGSRHGKGYMVTKSGDLWICPFVNDVPTGRCAIYFSTGDYFEGQLRNGNTSEGKMTFADGSYYIGEFMADGYMNGKGVYYDTANGTRYEGVWKNNLKDGPGKLYQHEVWKEGARIDRLSGQGHRIPEVFENNKNAHWKAQEM